MGPLHVVCLHCGVAVGTVSSQWHRVSDGRDGAALPKLGTEKLHGSASGSMFTMKSCDYKKQKPQSLNLGDLTLTR